MDHHRKLFGIALLLAGIAASPLLLAHGEGEPAPQQPVTQEQKPWGIAGDGEQVTRTLEVDMDDQMRFSPKQIEVKLGETIRFVVVNRGMLLHEFVLGTAQELDKHAAMMVKFPGMEHAEPYMAHVAPGQQAELIWTFNRAGDFNFACLIAGHYQAGMVGQIRVVE